MSSDPVPSPNVVLDLLEAFRRSKTMFAAVKLGVFEALSVRPADAEELAIILKCNPEATQTLLDSCVALDLLERSNEGVYSNTPAASVYLCKVSPRRMTGYIQYSNDVMWKMWANLEDAIRQGTNRWSQVYGTEGPIFEHFFRNDQAMEEFLMGMHGFGMITSPIVVRAFDLSGYRHLVDLGGATGHLAIEACKAYPGLWATVLDLPKALGLAERMVVEVGFQDRIQLVGSDFFIDPLPQADLFYLGRILHDWSLSKIRLLLRKIYEALPSGGALLIGEKMIAPERDGPRWALMQSLNMLVCTEGTERTFDEYDKLLKEAGFADVLGHVTDVPLDAILATKA